MTDDDAELAQYGINDIRLAQLRAILRRAGISDIDAHCNTCCFSQNCDDDINEYCGIIREIRTLQNAQKRYAITHYPSSAIIF